LVGIKYRSLRLAIHMEVSTFQPKMMAQSFRQSHLKSFITLPLASNWLLKSQA
jgi:hypothetical protein